MISYFVFTCLLIFVYIHTFYDWISFVLLFRAVGNFLKNNLGSSPDRTSNRPRALAGGGS